MRKLDQGPYYQYGGTPPYDHLVITATLFWPEKKLSQSIFYLKNPFNTTSFPWPEGGRINGVPATVCVKQHLSLRSQFPPQGYSRTPIAHRVLQGASYLERKRTRTPLSNNVSQKEGGEET